MIEAGSNISIITVYYIVQREIGSLLKHSAYINVRK